MDDSRDSPMLRSLHYGNVVVVEVIQLSKLLNLPKLRVARGTKEKFIKNVTNILTRPRGNGVMDSKLTCWTGGPGSIPTVGKSNVQYSDGFSLSV